MTYHSIFMWLFNILCLYIASDLSMACQLQVNAPLNSCSNHVASCSTLLLVLRSRFDILYMRHMWLFIVPIRGDLVMVPCLRHDLPLNIQVAAQHMVCLYCVSILRLISIAPRAGKNFGRLGGGVCSGISLKQLQCSKSSWLNLGYIQIVNLKLNKPNLTVS